MEDANKYNKPGALIIVLPVPSHYTLNILFDAMSVLIILY